MRRTFFEKIVFSKHDGYNNNKTCNFTFTNILTSSARNPDFSEGAPVASLCPEMSNKLSLQDPTPMANDSFHNNGKHYFFA